MLLVLGLLPSYFWHLQADRDNIPNFKRYEMTYTNAQLSCPNEIRKEKRYKERGLAEGKKKREIRMIGTLEISRREEKK